MSSRNGSIDGWDLYLSCVTLCYPPVTSIELLLPFHIVPIGGSFLSPFHICLPKARICRALQQTLSAQMCQLNALLQAVWSVLCSEGTLEEK